jgi:hypothetical protein
MAQNWRRLLLLVALILSPCYGFPAARSGGAATPPPVKQIDHILIRVNDPRRLFSFFADTLQLPVAWPVATYKGFTSGGVGVGNVNVEVIRLDDGKDSPPAEPADARLIGFAFEPYPLADSLRKLASRGVKYDEPSPYVSTQADGSKKTLWTTVNLPQFSGGDIGIFLCEYDPSFMNVESVRAGLRDQLRAKKGGPLGVESVKEVVWGAADFKQAVERWRKLLEPIPQSEPGVWSVGDGPAMHLIPSKEDKIQGLVLYVASLTRAKAFLRKNHRLGPVSGKEVAIDPSKIQGLSIRLIERK